MSNIVFPGALDALWNGEIVYSTDNLVIVLVSSAFTPTLSMDTLSEVASGSIIATSTPLTSKTVTDGVFDAADKTFTALTGATVRAYLLVKSTGIPSTSRLISYTDTNQDTTSINVAPDGTNFTIRFSASGICKI